MSPHERQASQMYVNIREHFDELWKERELRLSQSAQNLEKALLLARQELAEKMSEMGNIRRDYMPKTEFDAKHALIEAKVQTLHDYQTTMEAKASQTSVWISYALSITGILISLLAIFWKHLGGGN